MFHQSSFWRRDHIFINDIYNKTEMCKVPLNPSSQHPSQPVYLRINQRQVRRSGLLILLIGHDVETARILRVATGHRGWFQPFTNISGVVIGCYWGVNFPTRKSKKISKSNTTSTISQQPSPTKHWSLSETAKVCCIGFRNRWTSTSSVPRFPPWAWYAYASTQPGDASDCTMQVKDVGSETESQIQTQSQ